jgi:hypothetical protein
MARSLTIDEGLGGLDFVSSIFFFSNPIGTRARSHLSLRSHSLLSAIAPSRALNEDRPYRRQITRRPGVRPLRGGEGRPSLPTRMSYRLSLLTSNVDEAIQGLSRSSRNCRSTPQTTKTGAMLTEDSVSEDTKTADVPESKSGKSKNP